MPVFIAMRIACEMLTLYDYLGIGTGVLTRTSDGRLEWVERHTFEGRFGDYWTCEHCDVISHFATCPDAARFRRGGVK
jgi:hypothetical protein